jgi:hypothetical protein
MCNFLFWLLLLFHFIAFSQFRRMTYICTFVFWDKRPCSLLKIKQNSFSHLFHSGFLLDTCSSVQFFDLKMKVIFSSDTYGALSKKIWLKVFHSTKMYVKFEHYFFKIYSNLLMLKTEIAVILELNKKALK